MCVEGVKVYAPIDTKWWVHEGLCFTCAGICGFLVQQLVPCEERK